MEFPGNDAATENVCTLRVVDGEGAILAVTAPSVDQLHRKALPGPVGPQAMLYKGRFSGHAGQGKQGSTVVHREVTVLIDTGATEDFAGDHYIRRHNLKTFAAPDLPVALADGKRLIANRMVAMTLRFGEYKYTRNVYVLPLGARVRGHHSRHAMALQSGIIQLQHAHA